MIVFDIDHGVAKGYRPVDREHPFLLPPDMREWLPASHPVWMFIEAVRLLDTSGLHERCRTGGAGRAGYDPDMVLTLVMYAYARGVYSSRQIERLCYEDVAFRVICAQDVPDHTTIWRFADMAPELVKTLFTQVLQLCAKAGMVRLETIALDGMKMVANASKEANSSEERIRAELGRLAASAVAKHRATDAQDALFEVGAGGDEVPAELADPRTRGPRLARALAELVGEREAVNAERAEKAKEHLRRMQEGERVKGRPPLAAEVAAAQLRVEQAIAAQQAKIDQFARHNATKIAETGAALAQRPPLPVEEHPSVVQAQASHAKALARQAERDQQQEQQPPAVRNVTDPDSRLMPTRSGFIQGYNTQNVNTEDLFILATDVTQDCGDVEQWQPMMDQAQTNADLVNAARTDHAQATGQPCTCPPANDNDDHQDPPPPAADATTTQPEPICPLHPNTIGTAIGDAGYLSKDNLTAPGPTPLIATGKRRDLETAARNQPEPETTPPDHDPHTEPDPVEAMAQRLRTPEAMATYRRRGHIAETLHGHIKHNRRKRAFARRGLHRVKTEWTLICTVNNLERLLRNLRVTGQPLPAVI